MSTLDSIGMFYFCVQDHDIEDLVDKIVAYGSKQ